MGMGATSEFACKGVTTSPLFGPTRHPLNPDLTPGGSSGGPATAVAADLVPLAIGTDAGGSSRRPPAHVGVVGFKPSYGAIPYGPGFAEPFFDISVIAPIARNVADAALAFEAMAGPDPRILIPRWLKAVTSIWLICVSHSRRSWGSTHPSIPPSPEGWRPSSNISAKEDSESSVVIRSGRPARPRKR